MKTTMVERMRSARYASGVTLLEVLVAFSILGVSLVLIFSIFSSGLRTASQGEDYTRATALAESKLATMTVTERLQDGVGEGVFDDRYRWRTTVATPAWWEASESGARFKPYEVKIEVAWHDSGREYAVSLTTLRLAHNPL